MDLADERSAGVIRTATDADWPQIWPFLQEIQVDAVVVADTVADQRAEVGRLG